MLSFTQKPVRLVGRHPAGGLSDGAVFLPKACAEREAGLLTNHKRMDNNNRPDTDLERSSQIIYFIRLPEDYDREDAQRSFSENVPESQPSETYRWPRSFALMRELAAIDEPDLAEASRHELSRDDARDFGRRLLALADSLEERGRNISSEEQPDGAIRSYSMDPADGRWLPEIRSSFAQVLETLREAGRWYSQVDGEPVAIPA